MEIARKIEEHKGDKELNLDVLKSLEGNFVRKVSETKQGRISTPLIVPMASYKILANVLRITIHYSAY